MDKAVAELKKQMDEITKSNRGYAMNNLPKMDEKIRKILEGLCEDLGELIPGLFQRVEAE
ncbi:MAG: hypothetical protein ACYCSA_07640 [Thermoplasmataceae archaeon]